MPVTYIQALTVVATNDCNYINTVVSYANPNAAFPLTGEVVYKDMAGNTLNASTITAVLTSSGDSISIITPVEDLGNPTGVVKVIYQINNNVVDENAVLLACDIDCCLTKLTNELLDCACDCPKCASALAKAQKIFLLLQSSLSGVELGATASTITSAGYYNELVEKYKKAKEICDNSCGCDC